MTDIVKRLRAIDHLSIEDCFLQSPLFGDAADEIERLRALLNEAADDLDDWGAYSKAIKYRQDDRTTK